MTKDRIEILIPQENANDESVIITSVISNGSSVKKGDVIFEFETSKSVIDFEAPADGFFFCYFNEGEEVSVGEVCGYVSEKNKFIEKKIKKEKQKNTDEKKFSKKALIKAKSLGIDISFFADSKRVSEKDIDEYAKTLTKDDSDEILKFIDSINFTDDDLFLYGAGLQAQVVLDLFDDKSEIDRVKLIIDSSPKFSELNGIRVIKPEYISKIIEKGCRKAHICIGDSKAKKQVANMLLSSGLELVTLIHRTAIVSNSASLGSNVYLGPGVYVGPEVEIKDYVQINNFSSIAHHSVLEECVMISDGCRVGGTVKIGESALLGINVSVNRDISIGKNVLIPTGERVLKNLGDNEKVKFKG